MGLQDVSQGIVNYYKDCINIYNQLQLLYNRYSQGLFLCISDPPKLAKKWPSWKDKNDFYSSSESVIDKTTPIWGLNYDAS